MSRILVVEDEKDIRELIKINLVKEGYSVETAADGLDGYQKIQGTQYDLVILDVMLPQIDGITLCKRIKSNPHLLQTPVLIVSAKNLEEDILQGLEHGADDYVSKPFSMKILIAKIRGLLKKSEVIMSLLRYGALEVNLQKRTVEVETQKCELTYSEFELLRLLVEKPGFVWSRSQIVEKLRGANHAITDRAVDVIVVGLRKKIGEYGESIETVRGVGYKLKEIRND